MRVSTKSNYNNMNKKLLTIITGTAFAGSLYGGIPLSDDLTVTGYMDASYTDYEGKKDAGSAENNFQEFELGFQFAPAESPVSAVMELSFKPGKGNSLLDPTKLNTLTFNDANANGTVESGELVTGTATVPGVTEVADRLFLETATITYAFSDSLSVTTGNMLTYMGWETYDATGLYQMTYAYRNNKPNPYEGYAFGASLDYAVEGVNLGMALADSDNGDISLEVAGKFTSIPNTTIFAMVANDPGFTTVNSWASYSMGGLTLAAEYIKKDIEKDSIGTDQAAEKEAYLLMANYALDSGAAVTVRYSAQEDEKEDGTNVTKGDFEKFTVSPSYAFTDNLKGFFEISQVNQSTGDDYGLYGVKVLFTF